MALILGLAGCGGGDGYGYQMDPQTRAALIGGMIQNNQQQQMYQQQNLWQTQQNLYRAQPAYNPRSCTTSYIGNQAYTNCQ
jgi:hypothetical protein